MNMISAPGVSLLESFTSAMSHPIIKKIEWPDKIQSSHPLRQLDVYVRYWPASVETLVSGEGKAAGWLKDVYHAIVAASICDANGKAIFDDQWWQAWKDHVDAYNLTVTQGQPPFPPPLQYYVNEPAPGQIGELPPVDYKILGDWLRDKNPSAQSIELFDILFSQAFAYNGYVIDASKNSETTSPSEPSTGPQ